MLGAVLCGLVTAAAAEAYKTTAEEGRKFSRLYMDQLEEEEYKEQYKQRECWRIGRRGVGREGFEVARRGVVCRFSSPTRRGAFCNTVAIAVKDNRPEGRLVVQKVAQLSSQTLARSREWCDKEPGAPAPIPKPEGAKKLLSGS